MAAHTQSDVPADALTAAYQAAQVAVMFSWAGTQYMSFEETSSYESKPYVRSDGTVIVCVHAKEDRATKGKHARHEKPYFLVCGAAAGSQALQECASGSLPFEAVRTRREQFWPTVYNTGPQARPFMTSHAVFCRFCRSRTRARHAS